MTITTEPINAALAEHQSAVEEWTFKEVASDLHRWAGLMILEFKLEIGTPALMIEKLGRNRLGHYRYGRRRSQSRSLIPFPESWPSEGAAKLHRLRRMQAGFFPGM